MSEPASESMSQPLREASTERSEGARCEPKRATRPRDAAATRRALLDAGRALFATAGYDATTVRAIAQRAGVNQALLFRYFGSKEGLFGEAVLGDAVQLLAGGSREDLLERTLSAILAEDDRGGEVLMAVLRATGSAQVAAEVRERLGAAYTDAFAAQTATDDPTDAAVRAELLVAWLLGIAVLYRGLQARPAPDAATVAAHVQRAARALLSG
ncbi:TetR/AcrR family transcriptional regulator [Pseudonocardia sp. MH-G8]|uniref:TetR/AcrR family transcriptional regulator n=1 Tax=Pseudonocardia sp. MH-G8 TaxID=1854588 RepID=UPI00130404F8|nr:TetR/AcrR family transcriptional regulator [Pseudonocardia sp. MH-G8]